MNNFMPASSDGEIKVSFSHDDTLMIDVIGDFIFTLQRPFKKAFTESEKKPKHIVVNMQETHYMDSTASGMLLELREYAQAHDIDVHIVNMNDVVLEIFKVLNFHKLFKPEFSREHFENGEWVSRYIEERFRDEG